jgi:hypothetical protein
MSNKRNDRKADRQKEAQSRQNRWDAMSLEDTLKELDQRLGRDVGAKKQREKLGQTDK